MGCRLGWDFCILAVMRWVVCSGGCFLRFHWKRFGGRGSNYRFGKPHQLAIDGTMPANIKKFLRGNLFGAGWGIPGLPLMNSFMKPLQLPILYRICASRSREALNAMEAFKDMTANNDGWVVEKMK